MSTNPTPQGQRVVIDPTQFPHLDAFEWEALRRLAAQSGDIAVNTLLQQGSPEAQRHAAHEFMQRELDQARAEAQMRLSAAASQATQRTPPLKLEVSSYNGDLRTPLSRWFCEVELAMQARQLHVGALQVAFVLSKLTGRARTWAYGRRLADANAFPTLEALKKELHDTFEPPQSEFRLRAELLSLKQGNLDLHDYIQKVRFLVSCIVESPVDSATQVTTFMTGLRDGPVKTQLFREYPDTLEEAFATALREDFNARQARVSSRYRHLPAVTPVVTPGGPEPMDLSVVQAHGVRNRFTPRPRFPQGRRVLRPAGKRGGGTCHRCSKTGHFARDCRAPAPVKRRDHDKGRPTREGNERHQ